MTIRANHLARKKPGQVSLTPSTNYRSNGLQRGRQLSNLVPAGEAAVLNRYIGYYKPYAVSHDELDGDDAIFKETHNAARALMQAITNLRAGVLPPDQGLEVT